MGDSGGKRTEYKLPSIRALTGDSPPVSLAPVAATATSIEPHGQQPGHVLQKRYEQQHHPLPQQLPHASQQQQQYLGGRYPQHSMGPGVSAPAPGQPMIHYGPPRPGYSVPATGPSGGPAAYGGPPAVSMAYRQRRPYAYAEQAQHAQHTQHAGIGQHSLPPPMPRTSSSGDAPVSAPPGLMQPGPPEHYRQPSSGYVGYGGHPGQYAGEPPMMRAGDGGAARAGHPMGYAPAHYYPAYPPASRPMAPSGEQAPMRLQQPVTAPAQYTAAAPPPLSASSSVRGIERPPASASPLAPVSASGDAPQGFEATDSEDNDDNLAGDEDDALLKRRKRNAQSAARLRERRKTREQELTSSCTKLESQITRLQDELGDEKRRARMDLKRGAKRAWSTNMDGEGDAVMAESSTAAAATASKRRSRPLRELDQVRLDDLKGKIETLGKLNQQVCVNLGVLRQEIQRISRAVVSQSERRREGVAAS
ncbi:hypothetical protein GGI07_001169 [Coemansia sp. Benny D115]|nr:hypothetical protein GGI07_001169 [Coemansia sp. Benny D115]